jgi:pyridoxal phosphate enzyme (YggS family)
MSETIASRFEKIRKKLPPDVSLVVVSKTHGAEQIKQVYDCGQRMFGENKVQELLSKKDVLPGDIEWHLIGHLQSNKIKQIAPFISLIHSVDSARLLSEIDKQGSRINRRIPCLLQVYIATEETKYGLDFPETAAMLERTGRGDFKYIEIKGLMGMASFTDNREQVKQEFQSLADFFMMQRRLHPNLSILSMGMSSDYEDAVFLGSNMVRIGSSIFGPRVLPH